MKAFLVMKDGRVFSGEAFGASHAACGEVVFNTSMTGYQEIITDPSYAGQIVVMTYTEIGNVGTNPADEESAHPFLEGFVVRELSPVLQQFRSVESLDAYLKRWNVVGLQGVDTRAVVRHVRAHGAMPGQIVIGEENLAKAIKEAPTLPGMEGQDWASQVTCRENYHWQQGVWRLGQGFDENAHTRFRVVAYDFGIKRNILRELVGVGCQVTVVPAATPAADVLALDPDGVFLSNGPGDPAVVDYAIKNIRQLLGRKIIFGICLGHQLLGLALGAKTYKLKFGHHGGNQPVKDLTTGKVEITAQNHGFAVDDQTLPQSAKVTHVNLNDQTVEGMEDANLRAFSVQYHPEASPGPHDSHYLFQKFVRMMEEAKN